MRPRAHVIAPIVIALTLGMGDLHPVGAQSPSGGQSSDSDHVAGPLVITTAASMASTVRTLVAGLVAAHPGVIPEIRVARSVAGARAVMDSMLAPDVFVSADDTIIDAMLVPRYAAWSAGFARSALVLAYTSNSRYADEITTRNWTDILSRPAVRGARGDPNEDPQAYRALMFFQLAAHFYLRPKLIDILERAMPVTDLGPGDRDLESKFASGQIDYMPVYRTSAAERGLDWLELPPPVNLGDTAFASSYAAAAVRIPAAAGDSITISGAPILYGLTVPRAARHPAVALAFARFALSAAGQTIVHDAGFDLPDGVVVHGDLPPDLRSATGR